MSTHEVHIPTREEMEEKSRKAAAQHHAHKVFKEYDTRERWLGWLKWCTQRESPYATATVRSVIQKTAITRETESAEAVINSLLGKDFEVPAILDCKGRGLSEGGAGGPPPRLWPLVNAEQAHERNGGALLARVHVGGVSAHVRDQDALDVLAVQLGLHVGAVAHRR